jgi:hypothetical protein
MGGLRRVKHEADLCVIGGGMAGICTALSAARHGIRVVVMHDRPVPGGNASSECRVHICGADRHNHIKNMRETGILEELRLENLYRNPQRSFSVWDTILYEKLRYEPNITLLLNCSCFDAEVSNDHIVSVTGWQTTTQTFHTAYASIFADCSGDAILAPLSGALYRIGREAQCEYGESFAPPVADSRTMGMTCLFQSRQVEKEIPFIPPAWAYKFDNCSDLPGGMNAHKWIEMGYWWIELGGEADSIHDTETIRDELLKITYGVWDHIKNRCPNRDRAKNWVLDWVQFLPAKRESRRYIGEYVLTQNDILAGGHFEDVVAYGGWPIDEHPYQGFRGVKLGLPPAFFHADPSPYGIPYRCLYSKNVKNLMFAGRNASCTHIAMSSTRVMGTGCVMGQAVGTASAIAIQNKLKPHELLEDIEVLQQTLIADDCYIPGVKQNFSLLTTESTLMASKGDPEPVRDGINRPVGDNRHSWRCERGDWIAYRFPASRYVKEICLVLDSALDKNITMSYHQKDDQLTSPPDVLPKEFVIEKLCDNKWLPLHHETNNHQRLYRLQVNMQIDGIRVIMKETWGAKGTEIFAFYVV